MLPPPLCLSSWTYHAPLYGGRLALAGVPGAARALGFESVELQDLFMWPRGRRLRRWLARLGQLFSPAPPPRDYGAPALQALQAALVRSGVRLAAWDLDTDFSSRSWRARPRVALAYAQLGLRAAWRLNAAVVRLTAGPLPRGAVPGSPAAARHLDQLVPPLRYLARQAENLGLVLAIENHADALASPEALQALILAVDRPNLGVCLDLGNFERGTELAGVRALAPFAVHAHAKCWEFDAAGRETRLDYPASLAALRGAGFRGTLSVEYEGDGDPNVGAMRARALIEAAWSAARG